jgi:acyl carrier protein phosphodiesterase
MNYLAHAYLSFNNANVLVGNMISDYVKGKKQYDYPPSILTGIKLHRAIDEFTDTHEVTKQIKQIYAPQYRLYAGAFVDVTYDYFLANDKIQFASSTDLQIFCTQTYQTLENNIAHLPPKFLSMLPYMKQQNWLYNYQYDWGIQKSFGGVVRRSAYLTESQIAFELFCLNKQMIEQQYTVFFADVKQFAQNKLNQLLNT